MKKKGKENLSIIDTYISHEFLEIVGIVSEAVHENYGNGHINSEFSNLQNPLWCPQRRHFSFFFLSIKIPKTFFQLWSIWIIDITKSWVSEMRWRRVSKGFMDNRWMKGTAEGIRERVGECEWLRLLISCGNGPIVGWKWPSGYLGVISTIFTKF